MTVSRRRFLLPLVFLGIAVWITGGSISRAQVPNDASHDLWYDKLTPEQIKSALAKLSLGGAEENDPLHKMLLEHMMQKHPEIPKELLDSVIKRSLADPKFLERASRLAQQKNTDPGRPPRFDQADLSQLAKSVPPEAIPKDLPLGSKMPEEWKSPRQAPPIPPGDRRFPPGKEDSPPKGGVLEPKEPPKPRRGPSKGVDDPAGGPEPGGAAPGMPAPPATPEDTLFRPPDEPTDPREKSLQAFAAVWERNIGPLEETPEVKRALFDLASGANGLDLDLVDDKGNSVWDLIRKGDGSGLDFGDLMEGSGGHWKLPNMKFPSLKLGNWFGRTPPGEGSSSSSWNWGGSSSSRGRVPSADGLGKFSFGGSWFPVIVLGVVVLGILLWLLLKNLRTPEPALTYISSGLGPWPVDPRQINTREDVVKAFEYLSVLICGAAAKTWTHNTIADALAEVATTRGETAVMLARLYELARYAPLDEPLTREELMEARELVCGLAGVSN